MSATLLELKRAEREREFVKAGLWGDSSLLDWFDLSVRSVGERLAVVDRLGGALTYAQLDDQASRLGAWMRQQGVRPGDVVGVQLPNWTDFTLVYVACLKVGAVINAIPTNLRLQELRYIVDECQSVMTFHPTKFRNTEYESLAEDLGRECTSVKASVLVDRLGVPSNSLPVLGDIIAATEPLAAHETHRAHGNDMAAVLFTSGSEAKPKGVMLSHNNLIASERAFATSLSISWKDVMFMPAPTGHATGFMHGVTMPIIMQIPSILCDTTDGPSMVEMICAHGVTGAMAVPALAEVILDECVATGRDLSALRFLCCGGSPVPRALVSRARTYGVSLFSVYGSTESAPHTMTTCRDDEERVINTDGQACWGTQIKIVDPQTREELPPGECGEEASRGPAVFMGYLNRPELTARVVDEDGWYYSGDLAVMDDAGYIRITGRIKDIVIRGGENISVAEVELILRAYERVREAAVIGVDDARLGQRLCACIVSRDGGDISVEELKEYFVAQNFAKFKIPEQVIMLDEMPLTSSGKISKGKLRERYSSGTAGSVC
ncbi:AMP-binding protein [Arcanobacterium haemolyticum]|nr:AMP-binding protein [Arcanobacterium haemolyticum]